MRRALALAHDALWVTVLWTGLLALNAVSVNGLVDFGWILGRTLPVVLVIQIACFLAFGLYRGIWRYASLHDLRRIATAVGISGLLVPVGMYVTGLDRLVFPSMYVLGPLLQILAMASGRIFYRWWKELPLAELRSRSTPALLLSSGDSIISSVLSFAGSANWRLAGILDDQRRNRGVAIAGLPVLGTWNDLGEAAQRLHVRYAILTESRVDLVQRRRAFEVCERAGVKLMLLPAVDDLLSGRVRGSQIRGVEPDDLLGRDPVELDTSGLGALLKGKVVMVTGAGGSIGAELCRQIAHYDPQMLLLYEMNEFSLYSIEQEFEQYFPTVPIRYLIGDVKDAERLDQVLGRFRPAVLFHAAAYKHVPMMERDNAWSAVQNNALGTLRLAEAVARHPVERLVFVSTDKAVNPTSVMGATKRLGEILLQFWAQRTHIPTVIVRFGNVLGSTGSVVPKFRAQIAAGGPVTVTDPKVERYFMTISEASQLVLQSALMGRSGEIFVLDMGDPVRIVDLARDLITLSGFSEEEVRIVFTGLRPGEKLCEELLADSESTMPTRHPKIRVARTTRLPDANWEKTLVQWLSQSDALEDKLVRSGLARFLPEYRAVTDEPAAKGNVIEFPESRVA